MSGSATRSDHTPEVEPRLSIHQQRILFALRRISHDFATFSRQLRFECRVTLPQLVCLLAVVDHGPLTPSAIGRRVCLSKSTLVGILDRLEAGGLIARERSRRDRRHVIVRATEAGRALADSAPAPLPSGLAAALDTLPAHEQEEVARSLERLTMLIEDGPAA